MGMDNSARLVSDLLEKFGSDGLYNAVPDRTTTLADLALSGSLVVVTKPSTPSPRQAQAAHTGRGRHIILCARRMGPLEQCKKQRESRRSGVIDEILIAPQLAAKMAGSYSTEPH